MLVIIADDNLILFVYQECFIINPNLSLKIGLYYTVNIINETKNLKYQNIKKKSINNFKHTVKYISIHTIFKFNSTR